MKVVGTGSPVMLTIRVPTSEVGLLRDELNRQLAVTSGAVGDAAAACDASSLDRRGSTRAAGAPSVIGELLNQLRTPDTPNLARELVGPTSVLDPIIRATASEAAERLCEAVDVFRSDRGRVLADQVRAALDTASACISTLIALDHVQNHAVGGPGSVYGS